MVTGETVVVTGCAGFIGSNLVDRLLSTGCAVIGVDNFSTGQRRFLAGALGHPRFRLWEVDLLDAEALERALEGGDLVVHLAANADVRFGTDRPRKDFEQNTIATHNVLEAMRANRIARIAFSSTGSVYGEATAIPTPEDAPFPIQTSLFAASKLACEGLISAYCEGFGFQSWSRCRKRAGRRPADGPCGGGGKRCRRPASSRSTCGRSPRSRAGLRDTIEYFRRREES